MKLKIYNYENKPKRIDTGKRVVDYIEVWVVSGDEVVEIHFNGGTWQRDSHNRRCTDFSDAHYIVKKENLEDWIRKASEGGDIAYNRIIWENCR